MFDADRIKLGVCVSRCGWVGYISEGAMGDEGECVKDGIVEGEMEG